MNGRGAERSLLSMTAVSKSFLARDGTPFVAVEDLSLDVQAGHTVSLIGESGAGKSTCGKLALGLFAPDTGSIVVDGTEIVELSARAMGRCRGKLGVVFQEPHQSLNPRLTVMQIVAEPLLIHERSLDRRARSERVRQALDAVELPWAFREKTPRQLSGGEAQRVGVARAIVHNPLLLVLDEPTSSLDLSVQAGVLQLLERIQQDQGLGYLYISHNLSTVRFLGGWTLIMKNGRVIEEGPTSTLLATPKSEYAQELLSAELSID